MPAPALKADDLFGSGIGTLKAVLVVDILFGLVYVLVPRLEPTLGQVGNGAALVVSLLLFGTLHDTRRWRWVLAGWVAMDLAMLGIEARAQGSVSLWLIFTCIVAAYVYWACSTAERWRADAAAGPPGDAGA